MKTINRTIQLVKRLALVGVLSLGLFSCDDDDIVAGGDNDDNQNPRVELIGITSTNMPSGNSCNIWNLVKSPAMVFPTFASFDTSTVVDDVDIEYLGQTTMSYQSAAYDIINKKYAVSTSERVVIYNTETNSIDAILEDANGVFAMEFVNGILYVIKDNGIYRLSLDGDFSLELSPITSAGSPSSMAFSGNKIYFIQKGRLYTFNTSSEVLSEIGVTTENVIYSGVEYHLGKIYATKRYFSATEDDFVRIDPVSAVEEVLFSLGSSYTKDYSRISSALDYNTSIYYLASSNGHSSEQHTITTIDVSIVVPTPSIDTESNNQYLFGLELKD